MATPIHETNPRAKAKDVEYADLVTQHVEPCVSIYTSDCSARNSASQCLPRLKNLLKTAEPRLGNTAMKAEEAQSLLTSNWCSVEGTKPPFPNAQGLAVFMSRDFFSFCRLPASVASQVAVGRQFLLRPLLPLMPLEDRFFVLALSQKHVRLFESSRRGIQERILHEVPENLHEDLEGLHFERQYQMHTAASLGTHQKGAIFHGPSVQQKDRLIHFFRDVDRGVAESLKGQQEPLIVAAVDYLFPIYKEANTYPHLLDEMIDGSPDLLSPNALHAAAWTIVGERAAKAGTRAFAVYNEHANTPLTSSNLRDVLAAAERGIIRFLFIQATGERWGSFVPPATVHLHNKEEPGDDELLNLAAILTIRNGGHVYVVPPGKLPEGADLAAVFRFALD